MRDKLRGLLGDEVIDRTTDIWGTDGDGELRSGYRPSGQPGVSTYTMIHFTARGIMVIYFSSCGLQSAISRLVALTQSNWYVFGLSVFCASL